MVGAVGMVTPRCCLQGQGVTIRGACAVVTPRPLLSESVVVAQRANGRTLDFL